MKIRHIPAAGKQQTLSSGLSETKAHVPDLCCHYPMSLTTKYMSLYCDQLTK